MKQLPPQGHLVFVLLTDPERGMYKAFYAVKGCRPVSGETCNGALGLLMMEQPPQGPIEVVLV